MDTHLGGILYLINLMQTLDLLEAFQDDWLPPAAISPWGVLEALGRGLLAAEGAAPLDDPIWWALASLDEREPGQLPGAALSGLAPPQPPAFRLPPAWVSRLPAAPDRLRWACTGGRLQAWFDQGYLLLDIPADPDPAAQLESELRDINLPTAPIPQAPDAPKIPLSGWLTEGLHPHLMHWLVRTIPYLHTYLDSLLPAGTPLSDRLLRLPARLYVTNSHVDLVARLAYVSVPVRMSGLDRSPGWLRHFGRVVQFHFK